MTRIKRAGRLGALALLLAGVALGATACVWVPAGPGYVAAPPAVVYAPAPPVLVAPGYGWHHRYYY